MQVTTWKAGWQLWDLVAHLDKVEALRTGYLFRGQSDSSWGLVPALYRRKVHIFSDELTREQLYLTAEEQMLEAFFNKAAMLLPNFERGPLMDRFIAQHYGVPTQLLDWTLDPFIALYFAVHGNNSEKDCALFYLQPRATINSRRLNIDLPWQGPVTLVRPPTIDDRVQTQKSVFTLQQFGSTDDFVPLNARNLKVSRSGEGTHERDEVNAVGKVVIPAERREQILFQLIKLGIDSSLVYPGLQGIGQRIADIANIQKYGGDPHY